MENDDNSPLLSFENTPSPKADTQSINIKLKKHEVNKTVHISHSEPLLARSNKTKKEEKKDIQYPLYTHWMNQLSNTKEKSTSNIMRSPVTRILTQTKSSDVAEDECCCSCTIM